MVKTKDDGKFVVYSENGKKMSKELDTKEEALKRLKQIEFFKNMH